MSDGKIKHLEMIQSVVTRLATNSFMIKGWSITLVSALFVFASKDAKTQYVLIGYFPMCMFWFLDGYFLGQERLFRKLYDVVRENKNPETDFSMKTAVFNTGTWVSAIASPTLAIFHGVVFLTICIVMFLLK